MFPFCDSPSSMVDIPLYQQLQLSPPSPKPPVDGHQSLFYYHSSPAFASDAFHHAYLCAAAATPPETSGEVEELPMMGQPPAPMVDADALGGALETNKDRHSKICTVGGMRDRRMRLSLDVARKFFALQDMLGFNKASKTVQWLLSMSKDAIREVMTNEASSDCEEDGSSCSLSFVDGKHRTPPSEVGIRGGEDHRIEGKKKPRKATTNPRKSAANAHTVPDRESRAKARERARERTKEKNRMRWDVLTHASTIITNPVSSSTNGATARMQETTTSMASEARGHDVTMGFSSTTESVGGYGSGNYQLEQPWELSGVVFPNSRLY